MKHDTQTAILSIHHWIAQNIHSINREIERAIASNEYSLAPYQTELVMLKGKAKAYVDVICMIESRYRGKIEFPQPGWRQS